jgi:hypothetical protein
MNDIDIHDPAFDDTSANIKVSNVVGATDHHIVMNDAAAVAPGAIWVSCWGYEACIASFFTVTRCNGKSIWLAEIEVSYKNGNNWLADEATPTLPVVKIGPEKRHVLNGLRVKRNEYSSISPWGGNPVNTYNHH